MTDIKKLFRGYRFAVLQIQRQFQIKSDQENSNHEMQENNEEFEQTFKDISVDYGIIESIIPLIYGLSFATVTNNFELYIPISLIFLCSKFFQSLNDKWRVFLLIISCGIMIFGSYYRLLIMTIMTYFPFEVILTEYKWSFNFSELYALLHLNSVFVIFWIEKWTEFMCFVNEPLQEASKSSLNSTNRHESMSKYLPEALLFFSPYIILNISAILFSISMRCSKRHPKFFTLPVCLLIGLILTLIIAFSSNLVSPYRFNVVYFLLSQFVKVFSDLMFWYILVSLALWLIFIKVFSRKFKLIAARKLYHFAACTAFIPAVIINPRLLVFAANVFIVLFAIIEFSKKYAMREGNILHIIHRYEYEYLDEREKSQESLVLSHLFLLLGCCVPTITSYMLLDGSQFNDKFIYFSLSGLIFVGIGDSMAAIGGKFYGKTRWINRNKTIEGSIIGGVSFVIFYFALLFVIKSSSITIKLTEIIVSCVVTIIVEALTRCFDNFLCPQICFSVVLILDYLIQGIAIV